ncbi:MAG: BrnT family toxin, partial [Candidatus Rokubacteria bacterium]|nr:BrnT family toxin [Candidatus Rokubacteria bacterium]
DPPKARANLRAHGISFAEAVTVVDDDLALTREDPDAADESRFVTLGLMSRPVGARVVYFPGNDLGGSSGNTG